MIRIWYSHDDRYHEFTSVSEIGDWIGSAANPSIIKVDYPSYEQSERTIQLTIGSPVRKEAIFNEFTEAVETTITDRVTGIRIFLARLAELYDT